jgi:hypothetical protein
MSKCEEEDLAICSQFGDLSSSSSQDNAVIFGLASPAFAGLVTKYPTLLAIDATSRRNSLNFPNTAVMVRSDEPHGRLLGCFVTDKDNTAVVDRIFEKVQQFFSP